MTRPEQQPDQHQPIPLFHDALLPTEQPNSKLHLLLYQLPEPEISSIEIPITIFPEPVVITPDQSAVKNLLQVYPQIELPPPGKRRRLGFD